MIYHFACNECHIEVEGNEPTLLDNHCHNELTLTDELGIPSDIEVKCQGRLHRIWTTSIHRLNLRDH